jgi:predicted O-methyltransferase YrrM
VFSLRHIYPGIAKIRSRLGFSRNDLQSNGLNPFATHMPVLVALGRLFKIERVLELGCGQFSTLTFLQPKVFPDLKRLHSFDNDSLWVEKIASLVKDDSRAQVAFVEEPLASFVNSLGFESYDLVFIDNSMIYEERAKTIKSVVAKYSPSNLLVVHDFETESYQQAMRRVPYQFKFEALTPNTGIGWNELPVDTAKLKEANTIIKKHALKIGVEDLEGWVNKLDAMK